VDGQVGQQLLKQGSSRRVGGLLQFFLGQFRSRKLKLVSSFPELFGLALACRKPIIVKSAEN
jgi:hypothetical protein